MADMKTVPQAEPERLNPFVSPETARFFKVWCAELGISQGELIEQLVAAERARRAGKAA